MSLKEKGKKLKVNIPAIFIAMNRKETPLLAKIVAGITVVYALSPIDLIPDFIPVIGLLDDIIILPLLIKLVVKFIPEDVFMSYQKEAEGMWQDGKPKKWYYAIPFVLVWAIVIYLIVQLFL